MPEGRSSTDSSDSEAFADRLHEFRTTLPPRQQLLLDAVVLTACGAQSDVRGYGMIAGVLERMRAYWLDPAGFNPQEEIMRKSDWNMMLMDFLDRWGTRPHRDG